MVGFPPLTPFILLCSDWQVGKPGIERRQHQKRQQGRTDEPANDHCGQRTLHLRARCACRNSNSHVQMMKSAKKWHRQNATNGMYCVRGDGASLLTERCVRALVIIGRVRSQQMAEMPARRTRQRGQDIPAGSVGRWAFGIGQPRRERRGRTDIVKGRSVQAADEDVAVDGVAVTNEMYRGATFQP
jgi:hypothetical protein